MLPASVTTNRELIGYGITTQTGREHFRLELGKTDVQTFRSEPSSCICKLKRSQKISNEIAVIKVTLGQLKTWLLHCYGIITVLDMRLAYIVKMHKDK